ncbi:MAG: cyclic nucleotide-binding domain-containing protein [Pseudomonadota bacterium]
MPPQPPPGPLAKLLPVARPVSFVRGALLVRQGAPTRGAFLIGSGEAEARVALPGGGSHAVAHFGPGDMFGEMALIERGTCSASVVALTGVDGWFVARDDFRALVAGRDPQALEMQRRIARTLAERLRALNARVAEWPAAEDRPAGHPPPASDPLAAAPRSRRASFDWRAFLPLLAFFEGFDPDAMDEIAAIGQVLELERGAWVFAEGLPATAAYLVVRGAVEVLARAGGRERRVAIAGPGELVGYVALLTGEPHGANARVREAACLLEFARAPFLAIYEGNSATTVSLQHAIHRSLLRSIARTNSRLARLVAHARLEHSARQAEALELARAQAEMATLAGA